MSGWDEARARCRIASTIGRRASKRPLSGRLLSGTISNQQRRLLKASAPNRTSKLKVVVAEGNSDVLLSAQQFLVRAFEGVFGSRGGTLGDQALESTFGLALGAPAPLGHGSRIAGRPRPVALVSWAPLHRCCDLSSHPFDLDIGAYQGSQNQRPACSKATDPGRVLRRGRGSSRRRRRQARRRQSNHRRPSRARADRPPRSPMPGGGGTSSVRSAISATSSASAGWRVKPAASSRSGAS